MIRWLLLSTATVGFALIKCTNACSCVDSGLASQWMIFRRSSNINAIMRQVTTHFKAPHHITSRSSLADSVFDKFGPESGWVQPIREGAHLVGITVLHLTIHPALTAHKYVPVENSDWGATRADFQLSNNNPIGILTCHYVIEWWELESFCCVRRDDQHFCNLCQCVGCIKQSCGL